MNWNDVHRRLERAADRLPTPAAAPVFGPSTFSAAEIETMTAIGSTYPADAFRREDGLALFSDADLDALIEISESLERRRDAEREGETP